MLAAYNAACMVQRLQEANLLHVGACVLRATKTPRGPDFGPVAMTMAARIAVSLTFFRLSLRYDKYSAYFIMRL